jgi:hypothetical protein
MALLLIQAAPSWNTQIGQKSDIALIVTVNESTGEPVAGLQEENFNVFESAGTIGPERSRLISPLAAFAEHPSGGAPGTYMLGVDGGGKWGGSVAIFIVDVATGSDRGRALTSVRF